MIGDPYPRRSIRRTARGAHLAIGGFALALVLIGLMAVTTAPAHAVSEACQAEADRMPEPWENTWERSGSSPPNAYREAPMYVPPYPKAYAAADQAEAQGDQAMAKRLRAIAAQSRVVWFTDGQMDSGTLTDNVADVVADAREANRVVTLVMYAIPLRDCGGYSEGGALSAQAYRDWVRAFRAGLEQGRAGDGPGVSVIIEPDALALLGNLPEDRREERMDLIRMAANNMAWTRGVSAYLDAATRGWIPADVMIKRLSHSGLAMTRGFSLNVANFNELDGEVSYGDRMVGQLGWKHYVVDTSRNGNGATGEFCNPPGRSLGKVPQADPRGNIDAYLWVKPPGESDGECGRGDPPAGEFFGAYANELAVNAGWYVD